MGTVGVGEHELFKLQSNYTFHTNILKVYLSIYFFLYSRDNFFLITIISQTRWYKKKKEKKKGGDGFTKDYKGVRTATNLQTLTWLFDLYETIFMEASLKDRSIKNTNVELVWRELCQPCIWYGKRVTAEYYNLIKGPQRRKILGTLSLNYERRKSNIYAFNFYV